MIDRQRLVIEGRVDESITAEMVSRYLTELSDVLEMTTLLEPTDPPVRLVRVGRVDPLGDVRRPLLRMGAAPRFFSVDIYTCKAFSAIHALDSPPLLRHVDLRGQGFRWPISASWPIT